VTEPTKLSINADAFIYSVNQAFEARSKANGEFNSHLRFEPFLTNTWIPPKILDFSSFKNVLFNIITHHFHILPNFNRNESVNIENISWFSHSIAVLFADINYLVHQYTGNKLPKLTTNSIPRAVSSKNIVLAIQKYSEYLNNKNENKEAYLLFPLLSENNEPLDNQYIQEIWSLVASFSKKTFGTYFDLIQSYILWKYTTKEIQDETIDWNVKPPCGAAYHKQFKELFDLEREERFAKRNEKNNRSKSDKEKRVHKDQKYNDKEKFENKDINHDDKKVFQTTSSSKVTHKENTTPPFNGNSFQLNSTATDEKQQQHLEEALEETRAAIQKMIKNKNIPELNLAPQNSFIRRHQHSLITESGFETESLGESRSRHVCIKRKH